MFKEKIQTHMILSRGREVVYLMQSLKEKRNGKRRKLKRRKKKSKRRLKRVRSINKKTETESEEESDSSDSEDSSDSSSQESSEEEKPKKKLTKLKKNVKKIEKKKIKHKEKPTPAPKEAPKPDLFELVDVSDTSQVTNPTPGIDTLQSVFGGQPVAQPMTKPAAHPVPTLESNMFANMNLGGGNQAPTNTAFIQNSNPSLGSNPVNNPLWGTWETQPPPQSDNNVDSAVDMFNNLNINQPTAAPVPSPATTPNEGLDLFSGMTQTQPVSIPTTTTAPGSEGIEGFGEFQDSNPVETLVQAPEPPKKDDAWSMGGELFNLSSLKKDSESNSKLTSHTQKPHQTQEANMLYTKHDNLNSNDIWGSAIRGNSLQNTDFSASAVPGGYVNNSSSTFPNYIQESTGFPSNKQPTGFSSNQQPSGGFPSSTNQYISGFPQNAHASAQNFTNNHPQSNLVGSGFPQTNDQWGNSSGFQNTNNSSGFPNQNLGGFPNANTGGLH